MSKTLAVLAVAAVMGLAGCGDSDLERGLTGAAIGGVAANALGGDAVTGAVVGGAAGALCDDVGAC